MNNKICSPCGLLPENLAKKERLSKGEIQKQLRGTGWKFKNNKIVRDFEFKSFLKALDFVNKVAKIANSKEVFHHPDIIMHDWKSVRIESTTHDVGYKITERDFKLAHGIDKIKL